MECYNCGNCKENNPTYYCLSKGEIIINKNYVPEKRQRTGWKKGNKNYEKRRRNLRKDSEN